MKSLALLLVLALTALLSAQSFQWVDNDPLTVQFNSTYLKSAITTDDSSNPVYSRLIKFKEMYSSSYYGDVEIKKSGPAGNFIMADTLFGTVEIKKMITDAGNNLICIGSYMDTVKIGSAILTRIGSGTSDFVLKLNNEGSVQWLKDGSDFVSGFEILYSLSNYSEDVFLLGVNNYPANADIYMVNSSGIVTDTISQNNIGTISDITVDTYNNIWCTGFAFGGPVSFNGLDTIAPFTYNDYVVKYDSAGQAKWVSLIEDFTVQDFNIESDDSGFVYLSGNLFDSTGFGNLHTHGPQWVYDYFLTKIDQDGNYIWINEIPSGNTQGDATVGNGVYLSCTGSGNSYITGFFRGQINFGNGIQVSNSGISNYDVIVLMYNSNGEIQFAKTAGSELYDHGSSVKADNKGNCYITGLTQSTSVFDSITVTVNDKNLFAARIGIHNIVSAGDEIKKTVTGMDLEQNYPNPFNPVTRINYSVPALQKFVTLKVYDILGNEVATLVNDEKDAGNYFVDFTASHLCSGIYFYKLQSGSYTQTRKMILLK